MLTNILFLSRAFAGDIAVLDVQGLEAKESYRLGNHLRSVIQDKSFADNHVLSGAQLRNFAQLTGTSAKCSTLKCALSIGQEMHLEYVVYGSFNAKKDKITLRVADVDHVGSWDRLHVQTDAVPRPLCSQSAGAGRPPPYPHLFHQCERSTLPACQTTPQIWSKR